VSALDAPPGVAIAAVTTIGYLGSFAGPPLIGAVPIDGLSNVLALLVMAAAMSALLARRAFAPASGTR
jgi:hypothetical protein